MKSKLLLLIIFMCIVFNDSFSQQNLNGWFWLNGKPQSNSLHWVKIFNAATFYTVGYNGTFMKSTDGGDTWIINSQAGPVDNSDLTGGGTRGLNTAHFFDMNTGLVGGSSLSANGDAIGRTTDGGQTFTKTSLGIAAHAVYEFYFLNSLTGYACGNSNTKLVKTTDAGISWTGVPNVPSNSYEGVFAFDENNIFITTSSNRIIKTTDAGATWATQTLSGNFASLTQIKFKDANTGYVTGNGNYFAYTTDGGINWNQSNPPASSGQRVLKISGPYVITAGDFDKIYYSSNNGVNWSSISFVDGSNPFQPSASYIYGMDLVGNDIAVVGDYGIINLSGDGGTSWRNKNYSISNTAYDFSAIWSDSPKGKLWAAGTPGSMLYSSNGGANWTQQNTNSIVGTNNIQMLNSNTGYTAGGTGFTSGAICKTTNSGATWTVLPVPMVYSNFQIVDLEFINVNTGWAVGGHPFASGGVLTCIKTTDGGNTWINQSANNIGYHNVALDIDMVDTNTGFFVANGLNLFKTTNGGTNWNNVPSTPGVSGSYYNKVVAVSSSVVFLSGSEGILSKSTDGGTTWNSLTVPIATQTHFAMNWLDEKNGLIGGTSGFLAKTTDGGITWKTFNSGGSTIRNVSMRNRDTVFAVSDINGNWQIFRYIEPVATKLSMNFSAGIEGFRNGDFQVSDTVTVTLRSQNSPFSVIDQSKALLNNSGYATVTFQNAPTGNYYLQVNHRNSIETWSGSAVYLSANYNNYNFTTSSSQAFGNNMALKSGFYCYYSGDINQDQTIDAGDLALAENANGNSGYLSEDVTGDNFVDAGDVALVENNKDLGINVLKP